MATAHAPFTRDSNRSHLYDAHYYCCRRGPSRHPDLPFLLDRADLLIAADGGANHCAGQGIVPDILVGDLDSINPVLLEHYQEQGVAIHRYPPRKNATDLELALDLAMAKGGRSVWLFGALGGRWDMSLANILLCAREKYQTLTITLPGPGCIMHILHPGGTIPPCPVPGCTVSLLPLQGDVGGLTLHGFEYPLQSATLRFGSTHGVSNVLCKSEGRVSFQSGVLLCIRLVDK